MQHCDYRSLRAAPAATTNSKSACLPGTEVFIAHGGLIRGIKYMIGRQCTSLAKRRGDEPCPLLMTRKGMKNKCTRPAALAILLESPAAAAAARHGAATQVTVTVGTYRTQSEHRDKLRVTVGSRMTA